VVVDVSQWLEARIPKKTKDFSQEGNQSMHRSENGSVKVCPQGKPTRGAMRIKAQKPLIPNSQDPQWTRDQLPRAKMGRRIKSLQKLGSINRPRLKKRYTIILNL